MTPDIPINDPASTVRHYRADGYLAVTRDNETNEHIIKSRGRDQGDKWTRRVPATRTTVDVDEHIWCIPDNWTEVYKLRSEQSPSKGIYEIPESDDAVLVSLCHQNNRITDAFHTVKKVGSITWTARAEVDQDALSDALTHVNEYSDEFHDRIRDVLQYIRDNPRDAVKEAEESAEMYAPECVEGLPKIPSSEFDPFERMYRYEGGVVQHPEYQYESEVMEQVRDLIDKFDVVPPSPLVSVTVQ